MLRYDGFYASYIPATWESVACNRCIRFYADGSVIAATIGGEIAQIVYMKWFNREHSTLSKGEYSVSGENLSFVVESRITLGSTTHHLIGKYRGKVKDDVLHLEGHNRNYTNGTLTIDTHFTQEYSFVEVPAFAAQDR